MPVTQDEAQSILGAAEAKAKEIGVRLTLVVTDEAGFLIALRRMDGASRVSTASFGSPSCCMTRPNT